MKSRILITLFISICILAGALLGIFIQERYLLSTGITKGVWVGEISLSSLEPKQAQTRLEEEYGSFLTEKITLTYQDQSWKLDPKKLDVQLNLEKLVSAAYRVGREGKPWQRFVERLKVSRMGLSLEPELTFAESKVSAYSAQLASQVDLTSQNARLEVKENKVFVVPSVTGRRLMVEKLPGLIREAILRKEKRVITLPVEELLPQLTTEKVKSWGIQTKVAGFSTRFNKENTNRVKNIQIAAGKLDGHIIMAGEEFSFNKIVGTRGLKEGYTEAPVIIGGKLVPGLGGGVCQVSSTLYNAILLADLKASKRNHHSMPVAYLPIGRDAAVAYDYLDLRFKNTSGSALLLKTFVEGDKLRIAIFGSNKDTVVDLESVVEEEIPAAVEKKLDPSLAPGQEQVIRQGVSGYKVKVWRIVTQGGKLIKRELVSSDFYRPVAKIVAVGSEEKLEKEPKGQ